MLDQIEKPTELDLDIENIDDLGDRRDSYRRLRREAPIAKIRLYDEDVYLVTRHRDVEALLRNLSAKVQPTPNAFPEYVSKGGPAAEYYRQALSSLDGEVHAELRKIVTPALSPVATRRMSDWITRVIDDNFDRVEPLGEVDIAATVAVGIPTAIATGLLHLTEEEGRVLIPQIVDLVQIVSYQPFTPELLRASDNAATAFHAHFDRLLERSGDLPREDLVGAVVHAVREGAIERQVAVSLLITIFAASFHSTMSSLTNAVEALAAYPDARERLKAEPSLGLRAWEEVLRYEPAGHFRHRFVHEPIEVSGVRLEPGHMILLGLGSANWDEEQFPNPDVYDIDRAGKHVSFGGGFHFCLGSHLSRLEGQIFMRRLVERFPNFRVLGSPAPRHRNLAFPFRPSLQVKLN